LSESRALLRLLQFTDSSFPTGGFSFSHGLEGLHALGVVRDARNVAEFAAVQLQENLAGIDLPAVRLSHRRAAAASLTDLIELDQTLEAFKTVPAFRAASRKMGRRLLEMTVPLLDAGIAAVVLAEVAAGRAPGHHALAFGVAFQTAGIDEASTALAFAAAAVNGYVAASVRLGMIGQTAAQAIVAELQPQMAAAVDRAAGIELDELGGYSPLIDLAGLRQPALAARMFSS